MSFKLSAAELLGFDDYIPPYATARGQDILKGVNFASAAAGIREETGRQLVITTFFHDTYSLKHSYACVYNVNYILIMVLNVAGRPDYI